MASSPAIATEIVTHLSSKGLPPKHSWVSNFLSNQRGSVPLASLKQTAWFRITQADITTSLQQTSSSVFPQNVLDASIKERTLQGSIVVQILDIEDIGKSRWSQVEAIEAEERGETTRGREIIRVVPEEQETGETTQTQVLHQQQQASTPAVGGPYKILMQDVAGQKVYGFEQKPVSGLNAATAIGCKLLLKNAVVARGVVLLVPGSATVLGGRLDELHKKWREGQKETLKTAARIISN